MFPLLSKASEQLRWFYRVERMKDAGRREGKVNKKKRKTKKAVVEWR